MVVHYFNPSTKKAEAGGSVSLRAAWFAGQPGLNRLCLKTRQGGWGEHTSRELKNYVNFN